MTMATMTTTITTSSAANTHSVFLYSQHLEQSLSSFCFLAVPPA